MKLFSNRKRPVHLGPFPLERLPRRPFPVAATLPAAGNHRPPPDSAFGAAVRAYLDMYLGHDSIPVADRRLDLPAPDTLTREVKATCYFLDASQVGVCAVEPDADGPPRFAVVLNVEHARPIETGNPAAEWTRGAAPECAALRATEVAVVLAGYIRQLGYPADARVHEHGGVDLDGLAAAAGLLLPSSRRREAPYLGSRFALAAVVTTLPLTPDHPLAARPSRSSRWFDAVRRALGAGGTRSTWDRWRERRRPSHLGRFPLERIRRREEPTTLILEAEVPRVPMRANFFNRARHGDLGDKTKREVNRFATKHPLAFAMTPLMDALAGRQDGPVASRGDPAPRDPAAGARAVKALSYFLGADMVGICPVPEYAWYSHDRQGQPVPVRHPRAVVMLIDQGQETSEGTSGDDWISGAQSMRAYLRGAEIAGLVAGHLRTLGFSARAHTNRDSEVLQLPLVLHAGLGELSRIGELVLNPFLGPRVKSVVVTTDMPLAADRPLDFGLQDICEQCRKCARECPCNAISHGGKVVFNGYEMWKPDVERCTRYRVTNPKGSSCGRCMKVCPFANEGLITHRLFLWLAIHLPFTRRWIIHLDDLVGNGSRNPIKKWWPDLVRTNGSVEPARSAHARDLHPPDRVRDPATQSIAYYPADVMPPPDTGDRYPLDRKAALAREARMERPDAARSRRRAT